MANFQGTDNNDTITGTNDADRFNMAQNGSDIVSGKAGNDVFKFGATWSSGDQVNGGTGNDVLELANGGTLLIGTSGLRNLETILLADNGDYTITFLDSGNVNDNVTMDGRGLKATHTMRIDAGNESTRAVTLLGGAGSDHLTGGQANDELRGNKGIDFLDGEGGRDTIVYKLVSDSTSLDFDEVTFNGDKDFFRMPDAVTGVDDVMHGKLNGTKAGKFNANLESRVGAAEMGANHAVVIDVTLGDWSGHVFLIVDANGNAGYQTGEDFVIELLGVNLASIDSGNFVT
jgi:hypothetical protein